jgi:hypothetical protein
MKGRIWTSPSGECLTRVPKPYVYSLDPFWKKTFVSVCLQVSSFCKKSYLFMLSDHRAVKVLERLFIFLDRQYRNIMSLNVKYTKVEDDSQIVKQTRYRDSE